MSPAVFAILCAGLTGLSLASGGSGAARRLSRLLPPRDPARPVPAGSTSPPTRQTAGAGGGGRGDLRMHRAVAVLAGAACAVLLGGLPGLIAGPLVVVGCDRALARLEPRELRRRCARLTADLPVAVDLLAACLRGGATWAVAVEAVADAVGGPLGEELRGVAARVRLGADPARAWLALAREPALAPLARAASRAANSGTALTPTLARLARDQRRSARAAATARARAAGVRAVAPLGLCFLPAFVLLGIVPAVAGIASTIVLPW